MQFSSLKGRRSGALVLAMMVSALGAAFLVDAGHPSKPSSGDIAGAAAMAMLRDEHSLAADAAASAISAQRQANDAADNDIARMKLAAIEPTPAPESGGMEKVAALEAKLPPLRPRKVAAHQPEPLQPAPVGPPLQLVAADVPPVVVPQSGGFVTRKVRDVVATVERIPGWVREATNWVIDRPAPALPRLTERRLVSL